MKYKQKEWFSLSFLSLCLAFFPFPYSPSPSFLLSSLLPPSLPSEARLVERKACFILEAGIREGRGERSTDACLKASSPHWQSGGKSFYRWKKGVTCRNSSQLLQSSWLKLVTSDLTSIIVIVLSTVNLQSQSVPISLRSVFRIVTAYIMATVWSSRS